MPHSEKAQGGALVFGGGHSGLGIVRSLGRHGIRVWTLPAENSLMGVSRFSQRSLGWAGFPPEEQVHYLLSLANRHGLDGWTLFPTSNESAALIARHSETLGKHFRLAAPPWEVFQWAYDKRRTYQLAKELGIYFPWTRIPANREELVSLDCPFPVILKPALEESQVAFSLIKVLRANNRQELLAKYDTARAVIPAELILIQELIPGWRDEQYSFAAVCRDGKVIAWMTARRTRRYPPDFGIGCLVETVAQPAIKEPACRFLAAMGLTGMVEMDWVGDPTTQRFYLLDVNARPWAWHSAGRRAGIDFPYLLWRMAHGLSVDEQQGRAGFRWVHLIPDLEGAFSQLRRGELNLAHYLWSLRPPLSSAVFALDDPLPALLEVPHLLRLRWRYARSRRLS
jgi:D-aspartate ligase